MKIKKYISQFILCLVTLHGISLSAQSLDTSFLDRANLTESEKWHAAELLTQGIEVNIKQHTIIKLTADNPDPKFKKPVSNLLLGRSRLFRSRVPQNPQKNHQTEILVTPLLDFVGSDADFTNIVRRMALVHETLTTIFPKETVYQFVKKLDLCLGMGCSTALARQGRILLSADPINFHTTLNDTPFFLSFREERVTDVHEFSHFLHDLNLVDITTFGQISWAGTGKGHWAENTDKEKDFVDSFAYLNNYQEDFSTHVGWYVFKRDLFLQKAQLSPKLTQKYEWIKQNVFGGKEFTDELLATLFSKDVNDEEPQKAEDLIIEPEAEPVVTLEPDPTPEPVVTPEPEPTPVPTPDPAVTLDLPILDRVIVTEKQRAALLDLVAADIEIVVKELRMSPTPSVIDKPLSQYESTLENETDVLKRISQWYENVMDAYPKASVFDYVKKLKVFVGMGSTVGSALTYEMWITATPKYFKDEKVLDIGWFAHFLAHHDVINGDDFFTISWEPTLLFNGYTAYKDHLAGRVAADFLTVNAYNKSTMDLTHSVGWYVVNAEDFRLAAQTSLDLSNKYEWIKFNLFDNKEF